jgi:putative DNA primase/helicase
MNPETQPAEQPTPTRSPAANRKTKRGPAAPPSGGAHLTDTGLAQRFRQRHGGDVRYCTPWGKWLVWDGQRWRIDDTQAVKARAKEAVLALYDEAAQRIADIGRQLKKLGADDAPKKGLEKALAQAKGLLTFALRSQAAPRLNALLDLARCEPGIPVLPAQLDRAPMLLNVLNGTLDLGSGQLREHRRQDLLTALAPVAYQPDATCPQWQRFLDTTFAGNRGLIRYLQKLLGYSLTGDVREQLLAVCWGTGANGKSTLINTVLATLGEDYAIKASRDLFMARKQDNHPAQLARLLGKRLVVAVETHEGARLDEGLVKELTGGDPITARRMREDPWQFDPTHKALLVTNHKPEIRGTDEGIWRRIRLLPFEVRIPDGQQDKHLPERLRAELAGVLTWCVQGCLAWQREGLEAPAEVRAASAAYRSEQDVLAAFLAECCVEHAQAKAKASALYDAYRAWANRSGESPVTQRRFGSALKERGYASYLSNGTWYRGLELRQEPEDSPW